MIDTQISDPFLLFSKTATAKVEGIGHFLRRTRQPSNYRDRFLVAPVQRRQAWQMALMSFNLRLAAKAFESVWPAADLAVAQIIFIEKTDPVRSPLYHRDLRLAGCLRSS